MSDVILVINAGSSSVKFKLFSGRDDLGLLTAGAVSGIGTTPVFTVHGTDAATSLPADTTHDAALDAIVQWIEAHTAGWRLSAAGHRIVHGGTAFRAPVRIDADVLRGLARLALLAPLHQMHNLAAVDALAKLRPDLPQVACFDTAFHAGHDALFSSFAVSRDLRDRGVRRYGFHGLSYEWIAHVLQRDHPALFKGRAIAAHLGNGASLCAMQGGRSIDTTMGMTALDGLPMGTRCGAIDPGAVLYMIRDLGLGVDEAERALYQDSGLKGLSGISNDVKTLLESDTADTRFALDYFALKTAQMMAGMAVSIGGADAIVFTGGIGEHAAPVRQAILDRLSGLIAPQVLVIPANEERMIAMHVAASVF